MNSSPIKKLKHMDYCASLVLCMVSMLTLCFPDFVKHVQDNCISPFKKALFLTNRNNQNVFSFLLLNCIMIKAVNMTI